MLTRLRKDERGLSAVIVSVTMIALLGAAMLSIDSGALWTSRRTAITGTDAAALEAARFFNNGADPCDPNAVTQAETKATNVLQRNNTQSLHNSTDTPNGFAVTPAQPCGAGGYMPGKVRFDGRLPSNQTLSQVFGFNHLSAFSSSTAAWGWVTALGDGLRPIAICDQSALSFTSPLPPAPDAPEYPHYKLWKLLNGGTISQSTYESFWGSDDTGTNDPEYPQTSDRYVNGPNSQNPNRVNRYVHYVNPATDSRFHTVHRIKMPDPRCGISPGNLAWVDLRGTEGGTIGASDLRDWLRNGYPGTVSISPHDCNTRDSTAVPENCGARPGDVSSTSQALGDITCLSNVPALQCPHIIPILVVNAITAPPGGGSGAEYYQVAFLYVVMRGFSDIGSTQMEFDFEFVSVQPTGQISGTNPYSSNDVAMTGTELCATDNANHCPF